MLVSLGIFVVAEKRLRNHISSVEGPAVDNTQKEARIGGGDGVRRSTNLQLGEISAVMCLLLFIALVAVLLVSLFEHLGYVKKKDRKGAHLV